MPDDFPELPSASAGASHFQKFVPNRENAENILKILVLNNGMCAGVRVASDSRSDHQPTTGNRPNADMSRDNERSKHALTHWARREAGSE